MQISAEDGCDLMPLSPAGAVRPDEEAASAEGIRGGKIGGVIGTVGERWSAPLWKVKDATLRGVGTVQEVLTGERTIGPQGED